MLVEQVAKLTPKERFLYWIRERHQIYMRRQAGKSKPWTDDVILQNTFFTNVYRELDKVTVWYRQNIREPLMHDPSLVFATIAFRWFNWPATGDTLTLRTTDKRNLLIHWDTKKAVERLEFERDNMRRQVFTGAFNISNSGSTKPKINRVCEDYIQPAWEQRSKLTLALTGASLTTAHSVLSELPGLGGSGFMAAQVVCDLKYTPLLQKAKDWWTWCSPGPGSRKGMNVVYGYPLERRLNPREWEDHMYGLISLCHARLQKMPRLHAQDIQNCLCETFKYHRALTEGGKTKRKYNGSA
jgi:hypothetical protein